MSERSVDELHRQVLDKVAYAYLWPMAVVISSTIILVRNHEQPAAWHVWIGFIVAAMVLRIVMMRSVRRDLAELRRRNELP